MSEELYLYFRSKETHRRLMFRKSEVREVDRDGWFAVVVTHQGCTYKVEEIEPERIERDAPPKTPGALI